ncbi:macro domain-containing protein [Sulfobacillus harzensis]|uniref:Thoeris protein ThsA Macro domain-containing protein n=1 Tax=Sulfobacillus harzensis TaxID=2729629 RepID=A0A7Y0Q6A4_9FIRM|nr:macro domain-containing protein [Sulfobacillus harzensis]NMP25129.1 hypothetical protein [Sulfobacillus harzensis]
MAEETLVSLRPLLAGGLICESTCNRSDTNRFLTAHRLRTQIPDEFNAVQSKEGEVKRKVSFFDWTLLKNYMAVLTIISVFFTLCSFFISIPSDRKMAWFIVLLGLFMAIYVYMWFRANLLEHVTLKINNSTVDVKVGDVFEQEGLKVIAFNEYFDTLVDDAIISATSLNGMYINSKVQDITELDRLIAHDDHLRDNILEEVQHRAKGKHNRYRLGTIFTHNDFLLTAFSKFDPNNRAFLYMNDYINFLMNFWNEVDIVYNGRSISIPLLGSGITRFKEYDAITEQELLELLIWSFEGFS